MTLLKLTCGIVHDPTNGIDGEVRDIWIDGGKVVAAPMDLSRPLWELHAITGVRDVPGIPDDAYYIVIKFQHAIGDGIEAGAISRRLFDAPDADVEKPEPEYTPPGLLRQVAAVPGQVVSMLRAARRTKEAVAELDALTARGEIPPAPTEPPDIAGLTALAATFGIEILGPPGIPA